MANATRANLGWRPLTRSLNHLAGVERVKRKQFLPTVLTTEKVCAVLSRLKGIPQLMAQLIYGARCRCPGRSTLLRLCRGGGNGNIAEKSERTPRHG